MPAAVQLTPDRLTINADGEDLSIITVAVNDDKGKDRADGGQSDPF